MAQNEKLRTEDIIEISDVKILTSDGHPALGVIPRESYNNVLAKIAAQILSPDQKLAFDSTLTTPSLNNPVVLKDDLITYVPQADLGEIKDSVSLFSQLPLPFTAVGNTELGSNAVTISSSTGTIVQGLALTSAGSHFVATTVVTDVISTTEIEIYPAALETATDVPLTFSPMVGDLRGVISDSIIYRWNGTEWVPFTKTGTLQHPELFNQNSDPNYQHLTQAQKDSLLALSHSHANKLVLDSILSAGSGDIITTAERNQIPSATQKAALVGTSGIPSASNPYITHLDPRLNTTRNPYVTVGPPGSLATFQGIDFRPFEDAILAIDIGSASTVKAIEVLSGTYDLSGVSIIWNTQTSSLLLENFTPQTAILSFQTSTAGIKAQGVGGQLIVRGFTFELNGLGTSGILSTRENTLIEDCVFKPGPTTSPNQIGITLQGAGSIIRRCRFMGELTKGVEIQAPNCRVESCTFDLTLPTDYAVDVFSGADSSIIDHCFMLSGIVHIQSGVSHINIVNNYFSSVLNSITDLGISTRYLENQPEDVNQPFIGKRRTVGPEGTYADYRGSDETPFISALADPNVTEIEILDGTYVFSSTVTVPTGKALRGCWQGESTSVKLLGAAGTTVLDLSSWSRIENLQIEGSEASLVTGSVISDVIIDHCTFNLLSVTNSDQYEVSLATSMDCLFKNCFFTGVRGVLLYDSARNRLLTSVFSNSDIPLTMDTISSHDKDHIKDNHFTSTIAPTIAGDILLVENNHFLGDVPTKLNTSNSIWQGNWPHPEANNYTGVDFIDLSLDRYLEASSDGVERSFIASSGTLSFAEDQIGIASTMPIALHTKLDKTQDYTIKIFWTCTTGIAGDVAWRTTAVFRDSLAQVLGTAVSSAAISSRTGTETDQEETVSVLTNSSYGLASDPTHVSFIIERVGSDINDTLTVNAHLLEVQVFLPRD